MRLEQGPDAGRTWPAEDAGYEDSRTGTPVTRLTSSRSHDHHLYFTTDGWLDGGRRLLFASDRTGSPNLFSVDVETGTLTQLTDLPFDGDRGNFRGFEYPFQYASVAPDESQAYFWWDRELVALDLGSLALRPLYERPAGYLGDITHVTADGAYVCTSVFEDRTEGIPPDVGVTPFRRTGPGFETVWERRPRSRVLAVPVDGGAPEVLREEEYWLAHVNTSPTRPELLTFAHYGPWTEIDHRAWCLNRETGEVWKIRPEALDGTPSPPTMHEYWLADGERIGYYGLDGGGDPVYGITDYEGRIQHETPIHDQPLEVLPHFHSNDALIVGDGNREHRSLLCWRHDGGEFVGPRELAVHQASYNVQVNHAHPRLAPDDSRVAWTSDRSGYSNVYVADVPDFGAMPAADLG